MPIEIRELVIHAKVGTANGGQETRVRPQKKEKIDKAELQEIVTRVVEIIKNQQER